MVDALQVPSEQAGNEDYDALPYPSMPFAYTQPERLAALTALFGLKAPNAKEARVLELGCASGGNIIPLAARYPRARFVGIDLSQRHIDDGRDRIRALALANVELRQADIARTELGSEQFDYLICHGVFSWVPKQTQDAILRICAEVLVPNGVAVVSYNVLPGWHLRNIIRDICIRHVGLSGPPRTRVANARKALELIAGSLKETNPYGLLIRNEARRLASRPAAYIMGEFLAADNAPCHFDEFARRIKDFNLTYLCEGDLNASIPDIQDPEIRRRNRSLAGSNHLALEQCIDLFTGRTFRRSVLVRSEQSRNITRHRNFNRLRFLHFAGLAAARPEPSDRLVLATTRQKPLVEEMLRRLTDVYPATMAYEQLVSAVDTTKTNVEAIPRVLFALVLAGQVTASTLPSTVGRANAMSPILWPIARLEAAARQPWLTNLNHAPVPLQHLPIALLPYLDGTKSQPALRQLIIRAFLDGSIEVGSDVSRRKGSQLDAAADHYLARLLIELERHALLQA
jgi:SAM-dependent methyltransferase